MEARGAIMHNGVYGSFGLDGDSGDIENACEGYVRDTMQAQTYLTGDNLAWTGSDYWEERHFLSRALEIYNGSIYIIHGLQDWNVDPHMAFPAHQMSVDAGFDVKGLYGQWAHDYPDRMAMQDMHHFHQAEAQRRILTHYDGIGQTICSSGLISI